MEISDRMLTMACQDFLTQAASDPDAASKVNFQSMKDAVSSMFNRDFESRRAVLKTAFSEFSFEDNVGAGKKKKPKNNSSSKDKDIKDDPDGVNFLDGDDISLGDDDDFLGGDIDDDDSDNDDSDNEPRQSKLKTRREGASRKVTVTGGAKGSGFTAPVMLSGPLADFIGEDVYPRTHVPKRIWEYIKANDLQDPSNRKMILCDVTLEKIMKTKRIHMFTMTKELNKHMHKIEEVDPNPYARSNNKLKKDKPVKAKKVVKPKAKPKKKEVKKKMNRKGKGVKNPNVGNSPFMRPVRLSFKLSALLGEEILPRPHVVKKMWEVIKERGLQNPADKREIMCDASFRDTFGVPKMTMFDMNRYLSAHLEKIEDSDLPNWYDKDMYGEGAKIEPKGSKGVKREREVAESSEEEAEFDDGEEEDDSESEGDSEEEEEGEDGEPIEAEEIVREGLKGKIPETEDGESEESASLAVSGDSESETEAKWFSS